MNLTNWYRNIGKAVLVLAPLLSPALAQTKLDLNQAREADLDGLTGLGPTMTARILQERSKAPFSSWPDFIARVPGIGPRSASKLSTQGLHIQGATYPAPPDKVQSAPSTLSNKPFRAAEK